MKSSAKRALAFPSAEISVFLSYTREDEGIRTELANTLTSRGVQVNGDWQLEQGPDYWDQIVRLIEQSDVFLVLISPDLLDSEPVKREIEAAVSFKKRILPAVVRDVADAKSLPTAICSPQWAFLRSEDSFEVSVELIIRSIYSDFEDLRKHTELLLAARRWQAANADSALLLRGNPLDEAGLWFNRLASRGNQWYPQATEVQRLYYDASLRQARKRRITTAALILIASIGIIYGSNRFQDQKSLTKAAEKAKEAQVAADQSRKLAGESLTKIPFKRGEALELAQKAMATSSTPEAADALRQISMLRGAIDSRFDVGAVKAVGFTPNDGIVALGSGNVIWGPTGRQSPSPAARVWVKCENPDASLEARYQAAYVLYARPGDTLRALASSPATPWIVGGGKRFVYIWNVQVPSQQPCGDLPILEQPPQLPLIFGTDSDVTAVAISSNGTLVATGNASGITIVRKLPSGQVINSIDHRTAKSVTALAFTNNEENVAVGTETGDVFINPSRGTIQKPWTITVGERIHAVTFYPDDKVVAVTSDRGILIAATSPNTPQVNENLSVSTRPVHAVAFSSDGKYLLSGSDDQTVRLWNLEGIEDPNLWAKYPRGQNRLFMTLVGHASAVNSLALSSGGRLFSSGGEDGTIIIRTFDGSLNTDAPNPAASVATSVSRSSHPAPRDPTSVSPGSPPIDQGTTLKDNAYIVIGRLTKTDFQTVEKILGSELVEYRRREYSDGSIENLSTLPLRRSQGEKILKRLQQAGIPAELRSSD